MVYTDVRNSRATGPASDQYREQEVSESSSSEEESIERGLKQCLAISIVLPLVVCAAVGLLVGSYVRDLFCPGLPGLCPQDDFHVLPPSDAPLPLFDAKSCGANVQPPRLRPRRPPLAWCTSGGGWRAFSANIGWARAFHEAGMLKDVDHVAANSGGAWFLVQLAYSESFYNAVVDSVTNVSEVVKTWMGAYEAWISKCTTTQTAECDLIKEQCSNLGPIMQATYLCGAVAAFVSAKVDWHAFVTQMLDATTPGLSARVADRASRAGGLTRPTLHFQASFLNTAFLTDEKGAGTKPAYIAPSGSNSFMKTVQPLQWVVPGSNCATNVKSGWIVPPSMDCENNLETVLTSAGLPDEPGFHILQREKFPSFFNGEAPPVTVVAAMSSAAQAYFASPTAFVASFTNSSYEPRYDPFANSSYQSLGPSIKRSSGDFGPSLHAELVKAGVASETSPQMCPKVLDFQYCMAYHVMSAFSKGMSLCSGPYQRGENYPYPYGRCPAPYGRLADGSYTDNMATAMTVGAMQRRYGNEQPLRLILSESGGTGKHFDLEQLFGHPRRRAKPGESMVLPGYSTLGPYPSPQVFATHFDSLRWYPVTGSTSNVTHMQYAFMSTVTVHNPTMKVAAGTSVELLVLALNSEVPMTFIAAHEPQAVGQYADLASKVYDGISRSDVLARWLQGLNQSA